MNDMREKGLMIKEFRKKVAEEKENITDKDFFLSEACGVYLQNLATAITKEYSTGTDLHIQWTDDSIVAYATDRGQITINLNNEFMTNSSTRIEKLVVQKGLILHECGHLLFTDYHLIIARKNAYFSQKKMFPTPSGAAANEFVADLQTMDNKTMNLFYTILDYLDNSLEDGFIEEMVLKTVPGEGKCLNLLRKMQLENFDSLDEQFDNGLPQYVLCLNALLSYAKYERIKYDASRSDVKEVISFVTSRFDVIHKITHTYKSYERMKMVNELFCEFYVYMKSCQSKQASDSEANSSGTESNSEEQSSQTDKEPQNSSNNSDDSADNSAPSKESSDSQSNIQSDSVNGNKTDSSDNQSATERSEDKQTDSGNENSSENVEEDNSTPSENQDAGTDEQSPQDGASEENKSSTGSNTSDTEDKEPMEQDAVTDSGNSGTDRNEESETGSMSDTQQDLSSNSSSQSNEIPSENQMSKDDVSSSTQSNSNTQSISNEDLFSDLENDLNHIYSADINDRLELNTGSALNDKQVERLEISDSQELNDSTPDYNENQPEALDAERILTSIAENSVREKEQDRLDEELKKEVKEFDFTSYNASINVEIKRGTVTEKNMHLYHTLIDDGAGKTSAAMAKEITRRIKDQQQGGKLDGMYNGRYLDRNHLYRFDRKIFCKNDLPEDIPNMAISVLIDCSASMSTDNKLLSAINTALIIYEFGQIMNIPVMVYGHNYSGGMQMHSLAEFNSVDGKDKYRICSLTPGGYNRDGMALRYCADKVANRHEEKKFVFIISDGKPSAYNSYQDAYSDIKNVLMDYSKKKVRFITFGLGNDQKGIEYIYCQNISKSCAAKFVSTNCPEQLPKAVVKAIKELI